MNLYYGSMDHKAETTTLLDDSLAVTAESEKIGSETLGALQDQRGRLEEAQAQAEDTQSLAGRASAVMRSIEMKIIKEKVMLAFTIVLLLGIDGPFLCGSTDVFVGGLAYLLAVNGGKFSKR